MKKLFYFIHKTTGYYLFIVLLAIGAVLMFDSPSTGLTILIASLLLAVCDQLCSEREVVKIKYFDKEMEFTTPIEKIQNGDWIDLRVAETVEMKAGDYKLLRLGVGMILPEGYEAHVLPRSSTPKNFGIILANSQGVIDNSYSGDNDEWRFPAVAIRDTVIYKGDRIAQFRIVKNQPRLRFEIVDKLNDISRGGIGSTGKY